VSQPFSPSTNALARLSLFVGIVVACGALVLGMTWFRTDYPNDVHIEVEQPIPFSHKHHVQGLGLDCRFCHFSVERSAAAGMPDSRTCMTCHSQIWKDAKVLEPVRKSFETNTPLRWLRVHRLPDYVYFDHSIHVNKGVGCVTCHGDVSQMPSVQRVKAFRMKDCLECHLAPEVNLRPQDQLFNENFKPATLEEGQRLSLQYHLSHQSMTDCNHCHR
jgi:hypothetical protein